MEKEGEEEEEEGRIEITDTDPRDASNTEFDGVRWSELKDRKLIRHWVSVKPLCDTLFIVKYIFIRLYKALLSLITRSTSVCSCTFCLQVSLLSVVFTRSLN